MLEIQQLCAGYPGHKVLCDLSLEIPAGSLTAIIGPNGCGKSTLLKSIAGILPSSGSILLDGESLRSLPDGERAKRVAFLPQNRPVPEITVQRLILHGRFPHLSYPRHYRREDHAAAEAAMAQMQISHLAQRQISTLSGGERQKVYIAMLLAQGSPLILMDEPTAALDISHKFDVLRLARQLKKSGKTVIIVLHELDLALRCADRIVLMEQGCIRLHGSPEEICSSGMLDQVFRVQTERLETPQGIQYLFHPRF